MCHISIETWIVLFFSYTHAYINCDLDQLEKRFAYYVSDRDIHCVIIGHSFTQRRLSKMKGILTQSYFDIYEGTAPAECLLSKLKRFQSLRCVYLDFLQDTETAQELLKMIENLFIHICSFYDKSQPDALQVLLLNISSIRANQSFMESYLLKIASEMRELQMCVFDQTPFSLHQFNELEEKITCSMEDLLMVYSGFVQESENCFLDFKIMELT